MYMKETDIQGEKDVPVTSLRGMKRLRGESPKRIRDFTPSSDTPNSCVLLPGESAVRGVPAAVKYCCVGPASSTGSTWLLDLWCGPGRVPIATSVSAARRHVGPQLVPNSVDGRNCVGHAARCHAEVEITRGDTGKRYRFTFMMRPCNAFFGSIETHSVRRDLIVSALLQQILERAGLAEDHTWVVAFRGKNIRSETGAELLMTALLCERCDVLTLVLYPVVVSP
uniref:Uncharacterized protein n=1 Tax=Trypanosoma congolense (strain IL3000) TaxID=1068625 RepID=G0UUY1_TRYCI|nr:conserved hypothetical protein [Trypanosoma congolense IL3000]